MTRWKHNVTEQNIVALKTVSLNSPVVGKCPFYRNTASILLETSFFTGVLKGFSPQLVNSYITAIFLVVVFKNSINLVS